MGLVLLIVSAIVMLVTGIWLLIIGFQRSVWWGLAMIFIPFASLVFVIMYWQESKKPFLISLAALPFYFYGIYDMYTDMEVDPEQLAQVMEGLESGDIKPNEAFDHYSRPAEMPEGEAPQATLPPEGTMTEPPSPASPEATPADAVAMATDPAAAEDATQSGDTNIPDEEPSPYPSVGKIKPDPLQTKKPKAESPLVRVDPDKLASYKGRYFIITTKDGKEHRGLLSKVSDSTLFMSRKLYGGDFEYQVARKKVQSADMLKKEFVQEYMEGK